MQEATLRIWADHPFNARFLGGMGGVRDKIAIANKIQRILEGLESDGWTVEHEERDESEVCWVAHREFPATADPETACRKHNPERWGTLIVVDREHETETEIW